jgi:Fuc2NAc and GlcNAc transferase
MNLLAIVILVLFIVALSSLLTRVGLGYALARNIIDVPNHRSSHSSPIPRGGGFSVVLVFLAAAVILGVRGLLQPLETLGLLAGLAIAIVGAWDDCWNLPIRIRLPIHLATAAIAVFSFVEFRTLRIIFGGQLLALGAALLIWLALVWLVNLVNFMDGIDGLAGTEAVTVAGLCCGISVATHGMNAVAILYGVLAASASGFLIWNWHPAKIFMGDVASGFLGYCFGTLALLAVATHTLSAYVPLILLGVFIVDASFTLARRMLRRERWYAPHRSHAYQHLAGRFGHERTTLLVAGINLLWLAPWAVVAQWHPGYSLLCLVAAWTPLIVGAQLLRAGEAASPWASVEQMPSSVMRISRALGTSNLARVWTSTLMRLYRMMEHHGFVAKHVVLSILNFGCVYLALLTRFDGSIPNRWLRPLPVFALIWCLFQEAVLLLFRASRSHWRFTSAEEIPRLSAVAGLASITGGIAAAVV